MPQRFAETAAVLRPKIFFIHKQLPQQTAKNIGGAIQITGAFVFFRPQLLHPLQNGLGLARKAFLYFGHKALNPPRRAARGAFFLILPVVQQIVIGKQHIHGGAVIDQLVFHHRFTLARMYRAPPGFLKRLRIKKIRQQQNHKGHIVIQRKPPQIAELLFQAAAKAAVITTINQFLLFCKLLAIGDYIAEHGLHLPLLLTNMIYLFCLIVLNKL